MSTGGSLSALRRAIRLGLRASEAPQRWSFWRKSCSNICLWFVFTRKQKDTNHFWESYFEAFPQVESHVYFSTNGIGPIKWQRVRSVSLYMSTKTGSESHSEKLPYVEFVVVQQPAVCFPFKGMKPRVVVSRIFAHPHLAEVSDRAPPPAPVAALLAEPSLAKF